MKLQIGQWGNSLAFRIPKNFAKQLNLKPNDAVQCSIEDGKLVLKPILQVKEYTLDELLDFEIDESEEIFWGKSEGQEVW
ncbi:MAG: AbrB/MazE/SpoVT family DNA-binding domain-containing protein [Chroococcus sp. CMT-3BRIN-NPC107]|jgi:antitoxin MazE|nr:AbrB/MazE/SpoVT family DNA-binding domain-containing protein [Chroococcus sp. CMT-3BRIN-NPC107]